MFVYTLSAFSRIRLRTDDNDLYVIKMANVLKDVPIAPGDVLLFSGRKPIHRLVEKLTTSKLTQVGVVIALPGFETPLVLEATSVHVSPDIETGKCLTGVGTTRLADKVALFDGVVAIRSLQPQLSSTQKQKLIEFRSSFIGCPFDFSLLRSRNSIRRQHINWEPHAFTCCSLVSFAYQSIGVVKPFPIGPLPNNVLPGDFSLNSLPMVPDFKFGPINFLKL